MIQIVKRKISELKPADYNPRRMTETQEEHITNSLQEFGFVDPIIINVNPARKDVIIRGHQRVKVWRKLGNTTVPCVELDLTEQQERELNIRLNANTGEWDEQMLKAMFKDYELTNWGLDLSSLGEWEFDDVYQIKEVVEDNYEGTPPEEPITRMGDLYEIGEHRMICGNAGKASDYEKLLQGSQFDLIVTDPPYNIDYEGGTKDKLKIINDKMPDDVFFQFLLSCKKQMYKYTKNGGAWYVWHPDSGGHMFRRAMNEAGVKVRQCLIWVKSSFTFGRQDYHWMHEACLYGWKDGAAHFFIDDRTLSTVIEDKIDIKKLKKEELVQLLERMLSDVPTTVLKADKPLRNAEHLTMKPILLLSPMIKNSSRIREVVGDVFLGSGSTMVAAHQLKRKCYGMELDPRYCDVVVRRMLKFDKTLKIKRNGKDCTKEFLKDD